MCVIQPLYRGPVKVAQYLPYWRGFVGKDWLLISKYDAEMESSKWIKEIPYIEFPSSWKVKIIPPFCGAVVRFIVMLPDFPKDTISVYLDCYDQLGFFGQPYWEVYPYQGDTGRCPMDDTKTLLEMIGDRESKDNG